MYSVLVLINEKIKVTSVECHSCGPASNHTVLYRCQTCQNGFCDSHINSHAPCFTASYQQPQFQQSTNFGTRNPQSPNQQQSINWILNYTHAMQGDPRREPTNEEYEYILRSNPDIVTSGRESIDLFFGFLLILFVFGFQPVLNGLYSWQYVLILSLIITPAFVLHELGHKYTAIRYGKYARFTMIRKYLQMSLLFGFLGIRLAAPGATVILGKTTDDENGKFAAAGPAINFILAVIFFVLSQIFSNTYFPSLDWSLHEILILAIQVNSGLGLFNLLPVWQLDGKKILNWKSTVWIGLILLNATMLASSFLLF
ncbi:MAG: Zinc metalloprotease [Candidatus Heimdallarchaeota archaeon LC_2]|nr:MAG: Zinc metalloprotease [Candidatus Heimdallarchaeota archaeon LC_2]